MTRVATILAAAAVLLTHSGCVQRRMRITSTPPGATVLLNDVEIGRTPVEAAFKFYGVYDVRLDLDGYETLTAGREAGAPIWQVPGVDIAATVLPVNFEDVVEWHFELTPALHRTTSENQAIDDLIARARDTQQQINAPSASD